MLLFEKDKKLYSTASLKLCRSCLDMFDAGCWSNCPFYRIRTTYFEAGLSLRYFLYQLIENEGALNQDKLYIDIVVNVVENDHSKF